MSFFNNIFSKFEPVLFHRGTWSDEHDHVYAHCTFEILHKKGTNEYKLRARGHNPEHHSLYQFYFEKLMELKEGKIYVEGGKLYKYLSDKEQKEVLEKKLQEALEKEDYLLAEKIKKQLKDYDGQ